MLAWPAAAKIWLHNVLDTPNIGAKALEESMRRRIRCVFVRGTFVPAEQLVEQRPGVFERDLTLRDWLETEEACVCYWKCILLPFIRKHNAQQLRRQLDSPGPRVETDTEWLLGKYARAVHAEFPDEDEAAALKRTKDAARDYIHEVLKAWSRSPKHAGDLTIRRHDLKRLPLTVKKGDRDTELDAAI